MGWIDRFNFQVFPSWAFGFVRRTSFGSIDGHQKMPRIWKQQATVTLWGHIIFCALMWLCCSFENLSRGRSGVLEMKSAVLHMTRRLAYGKLIRWMFFFPTLCLCSETCDSMDTPLVWGIHFCFIKSARIAELVLCTSPILKRYVCRRNGNVFRIFLNLYFLFVKRPTAFRLVVSWFDVGDLR